MKKYLKIIIYILLLVVFVIICYRGVLSCNFINYDDPVYITENKHIIHGINPKSFSWAVTANRCSNWHPVTWISHMFDCQLYSLQPAGHHATNLFFHVLNTVLLFLFFLYISSSPKKSFIVAILFGIHPIHVESVAWISERKDVLSAFFFFLTLISYSLYIKKKKYLLLLLSVILFATGLMSKPMLVSLPIIILLLDAFCFKRFTVGSKIDISSFFKDKTNQRILYEKIPFIILSGISCIITYCVQRTGGAVQSMAYLPFGERFTNSVYSYTVYLGKLLYPQNLAIFYPHPKDSISALSFFFSSVLIFSFFSGAILLFRHKKYFFTGISWFSVMLLPVIGLLQVGAQGMADRYTYLPSIGIYLIISFSLVDLIDRTRYKKILFTSINILIVLYLLPKTCAQVSRWKNSKSLFIHTIKVTKHNSIAHNQLGITYLSENDFKNAQLQFKAALRIDPNYCQALFNMGNTMYRIGKHKEALEFFYRSLKLFPEHIQTSYNIAYIYFLQGDYKKAKKNFVKTLHLNMRHKDSLNNLGIICLRQKKYKKAYEYFKRTLILDPKDPEIYDNMGQVLFLLGRYEESVKKIESALTFAKEQKNKELAKTITVHLEYAKKGKNSRLDANQRSKVNGTYRDR
ncbi:MAG: tetratricopeptide repeat protein [Verrucomicrobiota bacterium]|nr:tetratricopeptide repeat protein [Verrucomicrobiota bacterium]